jgi:hypothetical protein
MSDGETKKATFFLHVQFAPQWSHTAVSLGFHAHSQTKTVEVHNHLFIGQANLQVSRGFPFVPGRLSRPTGNLEVS